MNKNTLPKDISEIVSEGLCISCGTCAGVCPQKAISLSETLSGLLHASIEKSKCNNCGVCLKICPGYSIDSKLINQEIDPFKGQFIEAYYGKAADNDLLAGAQSGGIATAIMGFMLDCSLIDKCLVTKMPLDGSLRPVCYLASNAGELAASRGSKYCPIPLNKVLFENKQAARIGITALPCQLHGALNAAHMLNQNKIEVTIGLFCDRMLSYCVMDRLTKKIKEPRNKVTSFEYRSKKWRGWPGDVCIHTKDKTFFLPRKERTILKEVFTPSGCRLCFDKFNIFADLSIGDAWGITKDKQGMSVIIVRTDRGKKILFEAEKAGRIILNKIDAEDIFLKQGLSNRKKDWAIYTHLWQKNDKILPEFHIHKKWMPDINSYNKNTHLRKLKWSSDLNDFKSVRELNNKINRRIFILKILRLPIIKKMARKN